MIFYLLTIGFHAIHKPPQRTLPSPKRRGLQSHEHRRDRATGDAGHDRGVDRDLAPVASERAAELAGVLKSTTVQPSSSSNARSSTPSRIAPSGRASVIGVSRRHRPARHASRARAIRGCGERRLDDGRRRRDLVGRRAEDPPLDGRHVRDGVARRVERHRGEDGVHEGPEARPGRPRDRRLPTSTTAHRRDPRPRRRSRAAPTP